MAAWLAWLAVPANQGIVTTVVSALTLVLAIVAYLRPRSPATNGDHARGHSRTQKQRPPTGRKYAMLVGGVAAVGIAYGLYVWLTPEVKIFNVCLGEQSQECGVPHDIMLGCNDNIENWAKATCRSFTSISLNKHAGNQCGYTTVQIKCVVK
jgi:hypothetical protein